MAGVDVNPYKCPVCVDVFKSPKLLPCDHLVCRTCVITWLQKTGGRGECPICRAPILPAISQDQGQLEAQVDRLRSDFATQASADSHKILKAPNECAVCQNNVPGHNFCLQCSVKLCTQCTLCHEKLPGTSHHNVEQLSKLTVKTLAARYRVKCKIHTDQAVELYCTSHGELICFQCGSTIHRACPEVKGIKDVSKEERLKSKDRLWRMKVKERKLAKQVNDAKQQFKSMRKTAEDVFDDLSESVEKQRHDVNNLIQAKEDTMVASHAEVSKAWLSMASTLRNIENLVLESPDDSLLEMLQQLAPRLDNLESQLEVECGVRDMGCVAFDDQIITRLKSDLAKLGQPRRPQSQPTSTPAEGATPTTSAITPGPTTAAKPQGAALARVLKVGDRVKMAPAYAERYMGLIQPGETGTVTAIPSRIQVSCGLDPEGLVDVRWHKAHRAYSRCMGYYDEYELILA